MKNLYVLLWVPFALTACGKPAAKPVSVEPPPTVLSAIVQGRTVRATMAGPATMQTEGEAAIVTTPEHKIVVERERVLIDGLELLKLRPSVDLVEFYLNSQGYFTMNADRAGVATKQLPSANPYKKQQVGGATRLEGRIVHYSVFGDGIISPEKDTAVITTDTHKVVVERQRVTLDGKEVVQLAPAAKDVRVTLTATDVFSVVADGYTVLSTQLSK